MGNKKSVGVQLKKMIPAMPLQLRGLYLWLFTWGIR